MIIGAIIAAVVWLVTLFFAIIITCGPRETISPSRSVFSLLVLEVFFVSVGAIIQLIQGSL